MGSNTVTPNLFHNLDKISKAILFLDSPKFRIYAITSLSHAIKGGENGKSYHKFVSNHESRIITSYSEIFFSDLVEIFSILRALATKYPSIIRSPSCSIDVYRHYELKFYLNYESPQLLRKFSSSCLLDTY